MADPESSIHASQSSQLRGVFLRSAAIVAASILISRVLGFFRDWTLAHQVGSNAVTDAYNAAFTLPDILNYLLAGGSFSITFIPVFLDYFHRDRREAWRLFSVILTFTSLCAVVLVVTAEILAPSLTRWVAPGFSTEQQALVTRLTRIMLPGQAAFLIGGVLMAVQYAQGQFVVPALAPLLYNGMIIAFGATLAGRIGVEAFSWGVLVGSLTGNCLLQIYGAAKLGARFRPILDLADSGFRRYLRVTVPIMLGFSVIFFDDWLIRWFGSYLPSASITWLTYSKNLMRVPVALFAQAAGVASFPILARLVAQNKHSEMQESLEDGLRHVILAIVPMSVLLAVLSRPAVYLLYSRTRMNLADIEQTALALEIFLIGAAAWATQAIVARGFYALGDTLTPTLIGSGLTIASVPLYWAGAKHFGFVGLAAASSVAVIIYTMTLGIVLYRRLKMKFQATGDFLLRALVCSAVACAPALASRRALGAYFWWQSLHGAVANLVVTSAVFLTGFAASASALRLASWRELWRSLLGKRT